MHISHLALVPDVVTSMLLDWSDNNRLWPETSREKRLTQMWESYKGKDMDSRAGRKLFSTSVLKPDQGRYVDISQKVMNATAARYFIFWLSSLATQFANLTGLDEDAPLVLFSIKRFDVPH